MTVPDCPFCDPSTAPRIVAETRTAYARLDAHPATPGHTLIVPRRHVDRLFDATDDELRDMRDLLRVVQHLHPDADSWNLGVNDGPAAGRTVDHLHVHAIPRRFGDQPDPRAGIRRGLPNGDPDRWTR